MAPSVSHEIDSRHHQIMCIEQHFENASVICFQETHSSKDIDKLGRGMGKYIFSVIIVTTVSILFK